MRRHPLLERAAVAECGVRVVGPAGGNRCCDGIRYWNGCGGDPLLARPIANAPYRLVAHANSEYSLLERIRYWHITDLITVLRAVGAKVIDIRLNFQIFSEGGI